MQTNQGAGRLAENVMHFARLLRGAGLPVGPDRVIDALDALHIAGVERRDDFYWTLASVFLGRRDQFDLYDQAFRVFWRDPRHAARVRHLPEVRGRIPRHNREPELSARLTQALAAQRHASPAAPAADRIEFDAELYAVFLPRAGQSFPALRPCVGCCSHCNETAPMSRRRDGG